MREFFSVEEIQRLEEGLPRPSVWSEDLLVPFQVRQLRNAKLIWLNKRWFLERGLDAADQPTLTRISGWLLSTFAFVRPGAGDKASAFTGRTKTAYADRYGSSGGTAPHGGSGRVAVDGCFQAKGVGITPLVGVNAPADHANGCATLAAGIREAVFSEVVCAEFPHGAVPVIALLDTGLYVPPTEKARSKAAQAVRRGIVVRPCVIRPAHAERASLFSRSVTGYVNPQSNDVQRTRDVVRRWSTEGTDEGQDRIPSLRTTIRRTAEQAAFGRVHRIFNGGYFSSNLGITGQLLDFGNMHALPDWANARVLGHAAGFGKELDALDVLVRSMDFYFRKYGGDSYYDNAAVLGDHARACFRKAFTQECLRLFHAENLDDSKMEDNIAHRLERYFTAQQRHRRRYNAGMVDERACSVSHDWLYDAIKDVQKPVMCEAGDASHVLDEIFHFLHEAFQSRSNFDELLWISWVTALRLLRPRTAISHDILMHRIKDLVTRLDFGRPGTYQEVDALINDAIDAGRQHWPRLPLGLGVLGHVTLEGCSALLCTKAPNAPIQIWIEAICMKNAVNVFGTWIPVEDVQAFDVKQHGVYRTFLVTSGEPDLDGVNYLRLGPHRILLPPIKNYVLKNPGQQSPWV